MLSSPFGKRPGEDPTAGNPLWLLSDRTATREDHYVTGYERCVTAWGANQWVFHSVEGAYATVKDAVPDLLHLHDRLADNKIDDRKYRAVLWRRSAQNGGLRQITTAEEALPL